ncbi:MAG: YybH family protein [Acidobacteriota bacterium]
MSRLLALAVVLVATGCAQPVDEAPAQDSAQVQQQIEQRNAELTAAFNSKDNEAMLALYTEDAISLPPNQSMVEGKEAIRQSMQQMEGSGVQASNLQLTTHDVEVSGDTAVEVGNYTIDITLPDGSSMTDRGKYLTVWKNEGGTWMVHRDIYNTDMPMPGMPGGEQQEQAPASE